MIEKMVGILEREINKTVATRSFDLNFIAAVVDFFRTYVDRYHHGKEEGGLFKALSNKRLSDADHKMILELEEEHAFARKTVKSLESAREEYAAGKEEELNMISDLLKMLAALYPSHICKEDEQFFIPCMNYFTQDEQKTMLDDFMEFDRNFTINSYKRIVEELGS